MRDCKVAVNGSVGCSEHKRLHHDHAIVVDECVCKTDLCNDIMGPMPEITSTAKTTTTHEGIIIDYISQLP